MTQQHDNVPAFTCPVGLSPGGRALWLALAGLVAERLKPRQPGEPDPEPVREARAPGEVIEVPADENAAYMPDDGSNAAKRHK